MLKVELAHAGATVLHKISLVIGIVIAIIGFLDPWFR